MAAKKPTMAQAYKAAQKSTAAKPKDKGIVGEGKDVLKATGNSVKQQAEFIAAVGKGAAKGAGKVAKGAEKVAGKGIVLSTTNGTLALSKCGLAEEVLVGAFLNQNALTDYLAARNLPVELICAGTNGEFSLDDFLCAGLICSTLRSAGPAESGDLGRLAIQTWEAAKADIHTALSSATHYNVLRNKGFLADLDYCLTRDSHPVIVRKNRESGAFETI